MKTHSVPCNSLKQPMNRPIFQLPMERMQRLSRSHTARLKYEFLHAREGAVSGSNTESSGKPKMALKKTWKNAWKMNLKDQRSWKYIYIYTYRNHGNKSRNLTWQ